MRSTSDARAEFARRLGQIRDKRHVTQRWIVEEMAKRGHDVVAQSVSGWERGAFAPDRPKTQALDDLLEAGGELMEALGYSAEEQGLDERVTLLEKRVAMWETEMAATKAELAEVRENAVLADLSAEEREALDVLPPHQRESVIESLSEARRRSRPQRRGA